MFFKLLSCAALMTVAALPSARATAIGVNFTANSGFFTAGPNPINAGEKLGVVPQAYWNNTAPQVSGTIANIQGGVLRDSANSVTATTFTWSGTGNIQELTQSSGASGNGRLYKDYLESGYAVGDTISVSMSGISYAYYDVLLYVGDFIGNTGTSHYVSSATLNGVADSTVYYKNMNPLPNFAGFVAATANSYASATSANYVRFSGVSGSSFNASLRRESGNRAGLAAVQIVEASAPVPVPAPGTLALFALGLIGVASVRARAGRNR